jgi:cation transporter-like permease
MVDTPETTTTAAEDEHARNARVRRNLLLLSLANWGVAILAWTISAYLGITSPASIMVYTVLFLIGLFAAVVAVAAYLLEKFAHRPELPAPEAVEGDERDAAATPSA